MDPASDIQTALVTAWRADAPLALLVGEGAIFDAPPKGAKPPYVTILRHDTAPRDGDETPGLEHRLTVHCWSAEPSRRAALEIAYRIEQIATAGALAPAHTRLTLRRHVRTDTTIDLATGRARAAVQLRLFSEPSEE
ncbi:DUF3168 domain-containing protein [Pelagibacterium montanilacus]|uniref:DUF3168 domain-containing protein n=1 Tax=Pelagibacterium montanilacus TaxID=2185280 RepID=UPI000F8E4E2A|nr:DUF3168 domain-containing protein [Pelagibacterium montanilacus]